MRSYANGSEDAGFGFGCGRNGNCDGDGDGGACLSRAGRGGPTSAAAASGSAALSATLRVGAVTAGTFGSKWNFSQASGRALMFRS
jgi:hypothetical protein